MEKRIAKNEFMICNWGNWGKYSEIKEKVFLEVNFSGKKIYICISWLVLLQCCLRKKKILSPNYDLYFVFFSLTHIIVLALLLISMPFLKLILCVVWGGEIRHFSCPIIRLLFTERTFPDESQRAFAVHLVTGCTELSWPRVGGGGRPTPLILRSPFDSRETSA